MLVIKCDGCRNSLQLGVSRVQWIEVLIPRRPKKHFCSEACLLGFYKQAELSIDRQTLKTKILEESKKGLSISMNEHQAGIMAALIMDLVRGEFKPEEEPATK